MRRYEHADQHQERSGRKDQDYGAGAHEDPVPAYLPLPLLQRNLRPGLAIARVRRIVQAWPGYPSRWRAEPHHIASRDHVLAAYPPQLQATTGAETKGIGLREASLRPVIGSALFRESCGGQLRSLLNPDSVITTAAHPRGRDRQHPPPAPNPCPDPACPARPASCCRATAFGNSKLHVITLTPCARSAVTRGGGVRDLSLPPRGRRPDRPPIRHPATIEPRASAQIRSPKLAKSPASSVRLRAAATSSLRCCKPPISATTSSLSCCPSDNSGTTLRPEPAKAQQQRDDVAAARGRKGRGTGTARRGSFGQRSLRAGLRPATAIADLGRPRRSLSGRTRTFRHARRQLSRPIRLVAEVSCG